MEFNKNWTLYHEREALRRYFSTHRWNPQYGSIDEKWWESEIGKLNIMIDHDLFHPNYSQNLLIQDKHRFWIGRMF